MHVQGNEWYGLKLSGALKWSYSKKVFSMYLNEGPFLTPVLNTPEIYIYAAGNRLVVLTAESLPRLHGLLWH